MKYELHTFYVRIPSSETICVQSFAHDIQCTTFATNHIREGENPDLLSFWVPQKEYENFIIAFS